MIWAILAAGGKGSRYSPKTSKLLALLQGKPVLAHSFGKLAAYPELTGIVLVYPYTWEQAYREALSTVPCQKPVFWVPGGESRQNSIRRGLDILPPEAEVVLIHDAARPLVRMQKLQAVLQPVLTRQALGASLGVPLQNSVKRIHTLETPWVAETISRDGLWQVHTPQVFCKDVLIKAHQAVAPEIPCHDDAELVERLYPHQAVIQMVLDDPWNLKITTPADLTLATALAFSDIENV